MKFHGLMLVRDEDDIIAQTVMHLLTWIDSLYIWDLGSADKTWTILQELAANNEKIILQGNEPVIYSDALRSVLFDKWRGKFSDGDWIMKIDADEFYHIPPPEFVSKFVKEYETSVYLQWYFFRLTEAEVAIYENNEKIIKDDRVRSIIDRRRFYTLPEYSEPRMFRYRSSMKWPEHRSLPYYTGCVAEKRLPILHYPHRDPLQLQKRFALRARMKRLGVAAVLHWQVEDWRWEVVRSEPSEDGLRLTQNSLSGLSRVEGFESQNLYYWESGTILGIVDFKSHLERPAKRALKRFVNAVLVPFLDWTKRGFSKDFLPE
jgi:hypothetical protein